jgi:hypothetical protein
MAAFLSVFSKKMTACPIPLGGTGYELSYIDATVAIFWPTNNKNIPKAEIEADCSGNNNGIGQLPPKVSAPEIKIMKPISLNSSPLILFTKRRLQFVQSKLCCQKFSLI